MSSNVKERASKAREEIVPKASAKAYNVFYEKYKKWRISEGVEDSTNEDTLLAYFQEFSEKYAASSLWPEFSKLKTMIYNKEKFDLSCFKELQAFIKRQVKGYKPKQAETLTSEQINDFILNAPDATHLAQKVL